MDAVNNLNISHGVAVIARRQTHGVGRSGNQVRTKLNRNANATLNRLNSSNSIFHLIYQWISADGCALFTLQLHIPLASTLGQRLPLLQHLVAVAAARAVTNIPRNQVNFVNCETT